MSNFIFDALYLLEDSADVDGIVDFNLMADVDVADVDGVVDFNIMDDQTTRNDDFMDPKIWEVIGWTQLPDDHIWTDAELEITGLDKIWADAELETKGHDKKIWADAELETTGHDKIVDVDCMNPQYCATMVRDIYQHLRISEAKKKPSIDYMAKVQTDIDITMRAILINWLVEVADKFMFDPQTLYLAVNYIDRYLSRNAIDSGWLQLLGLACLMIAFKYEDNCRLSVEKFCDMTANTYSQDQVLEMEFTVLNVLSFELTVPTVRCFLRRFVPAAQADTSAVSWMEMECLANYLAELSLLDYRLLCYPPSLIAASSVFLARYILLPSTRPWNSTLEHYTLYNPSDITECVKALHTLCCHDLSSLPAISVKYSHPKYQCVAEKYCPPSIPQEYFQDL